MICIIKLFLIIVANSPKLIGYIHIEVAAGIGHGNRPGRINGLYGCLKAQSRWPRTIRNLIAHAPENDGWMVLVPVYHGFDIAFCPVLEVKMIIIFALAGFPAVKGFIHDYKAHAVREIKELWCRRIMRRAQCIDSHFLHDPELTLHGRKICNGSKAALIMMQANAMQLHRLIIQVKTGIGIEAEAAHAKRRLLRIDCLAINEYLTFELIEHRRIH